MKSQKKSMREYMYEKIVEENNEFVKQGDLQRELNESKQRQLKSKREACIYGANYYTGAKIDQIAEDSIRYLKAYDVDTEFLKESFADITKMDVSNLEFLYNRENEINRIKETKENCCELVSGTKTRFEKVIVGFVNTINGGAINED